MNTDGEELKEFPQVVSNTPSTMAVFDKECVTSVRYGKYGTLLVYVCVRARAQPLCLCASGCLNFLTPYCMHMAKIW